MTISGTCKLPDFLMPCKHAIIAASVMQSGETPRTIAIHAYRLLHCSQGAQISDWPAFLRQAFEEKDLIEALSDMSAGTHCCDLTGRNTV